MSTKCNKYWIIVLRCFLFSFLAFLTFSGCGPHVSVEGVVTLDGQPLAGATIVFLPKATDNQKANPHPANGLTNQDGWFRLETVKHQGVRPGKYKVTVSKKIYPPGVEAPPPNLEPNAENLAIVMTANAKMVQAVPGVYTRKETTPIEIDVAKRGDKAVQIELKSDQE